MGCGASKRTTMVVPVTETEAMISTSTIPAIGRRTSAAVPLTGEDLPGEVLDDSGDFSKHHVAYAQPLAFEVPVSTDSLIRRHPPKRLQKLEDNQLPLTHKLLDERQAEAEQRRLQILNQRVQSAKQRIPRRNFMEINDLPQDEIIETVKHDNSSSLELELREKDDKSFSGEYVDEKVLGLKSLKSLGECTTFWQLNYQWQQSQN